jgi:hypothetical protein
MTAIVTQASRKSYLMTDEAAVHEKLGGEFAGHGTVNHSADEYARLGGFIHTNTAESFFALLKRSVYGQFHHVSGTHLYRYLFEADFKPRYSGAGRRAVLVMWIMRACCRPSRLLLNNSLGETFCHGSSSPIGLLGRLMRTCIVTDVTQFSAL